MTATRPTQGNKNIGSDLRFYKKMVKNHLTGAVRSTLAKRAPKAGSSQAGLVLMGVLCLSAVGTIEAVATKVSSIDLYKLYAHSKIVNEKQYICFKNIIYKESRWNPSAVNGSHYGLGQMKSNHYRNLDPYRQIDASVAYITKRYGSICKAWEFHKRKNYY